MIVSFLLAQRYLGQRPGSVLSEKRMSGFRSEKITRSGIESYIGFSVLTNDYRDTGRLMPGSARG